jgi:hypothetical protein
VLYRYTVIQQHVLQYYIQCIQWAQLEKEVVRCWVQSTGTGTNPEHWAGMGRGEGVQVLDSDAEMGPCWNINNTLLQVAYK